MCKILSMHESLFINQLEILSHVHRKCIKRIFQSYHGHTSHYSCLLWVSPVLAEVSVQKWSHEKPGGTSATRTQDPWASSPTLKSLPLSHAGFLTINWTYYAIVEIENTYIGLPYMKNI